MQIKNTKDQTVTHLNMLVYGDPGVGKTTFAATAPKVLIADCESGLLSVRNKGVDYASIQTWEDIQQFYGYVRDKDTEHDTIVIDSITELMKKLIDTMKEQGQFSNKSEGLSMQGWGVAIDKMRRIMRAFRDLPKNVIFLAHAENETDEGKIIKAPSLSGKTLPLESCGFVDIVAYMQVVGTADERKHVLFVQPTEKYVAKDRTNVLPYICPPDFDQIHRAAIKGEQFQWMKLLERKNAENLKAFEKDLEERKKEDTDKTPPPPAPKPTEQVTPEVQPTPEEPTVETDPTTDQTKPREPEQWETDLLEGKQPNKASQAPESDEVDVEGIKWQEEPKLDPQTQQREKIDPSAKAGGGTIAKMLLAISKLGVEGVGHARNWIELNMEGFPPIQNFNDMTQGQAEEVIAYAELKLAEQQK